MTPGLLARSRAALGFSRQELADALGVRKETVYRWETGKAPIGHPERLRGEVLALLAERGIEIERLRQELDRAA